MCFGKADKPIGKHRLRIIIMLVLSLFSLPAQAACVILLHGLMSSDEAMKKLEKALRKHNFDVVNVDYPSRDFAIEKLAEISIKPALSVCGHDKNIHFITHSLGGILVRQYLSQHEIKNLSRVVMLGPPNRGSEIVDRFKTLPGFHFINGDAGLQLGTDNDSIARRLGPVNFDLGVIAGNSSLNPVFSLIIPGDDDGTVSIESTKVQGMSDHIEMPATHTFMMRNRHVIRQAIYYLKHGKFDRS